jgi:hypothetical protein
MDTQELDYQEECRIARIEHWRNFALSSLPSLNHGLFTYASETIKALILFNAGSAAALLTLIGHLVTINQKEFVKVLSLPLSIFLCSAIAATAGFGFSYMSQCLVNLAYSYLALLENDDLRKYESLAFWGSVFQFLAVAVMIIAFGLYFWAVWKAYGAFISF